MRYQIQRVLRPPVQSIEVADANMATTVMDFHHAPEEEVLIDEFECDDFLTDSQKGVQMVRLIGINGVQYPLKPGKNKVPRPVYEAYINQLDDATRVKKALTPAEPQFLSWSLG